jgi:hypothetical protein
MGAGKSSALAEASDLLTAAGIVHAAIDLDSLNIAHLPSIAPEDLMIRNLAAIWNNFATAGVTRLLIASAVETAAELDRICRAVDAARTIVVRLTASIETMQRRIARRETGMLEAKFVARVAELESILNAAHLESFALSNDSRPITDVARELLVRAGWL